jgi:hypothetical protein
LSKAKWIRLLLAKGMPVKEIAEKVGVEPEYVRTVRAREVIGGIRPCDQRYRAAHKDRLRQIQNNRNRERYRTDPEYRARILQWDKDHPEKRREIVARWKAKKAQAQTMEMA